MNWIKKQKAQRLLKKCFQNLMALRTENTPKFFALTASAAEKTYYQQRRSTRLSKQEFEVGPFHSATDVRKGLENRWQQSDISLLAFAEDCQNLTGFFQHDDHSGNDLSPFVYVMY